MNKQRKRENWGSKIGVLLAVIGSAVGLGNFLRFPGLAVSYGGGAFMIPYFITVLILAVPLGWVEWATGRYGGSKGLNSMPGIFLAFTKRQGGAWIGLPAVFCSYMIFTYYAIIEALCLIFAYRYFFSMTGWFGVPGTEPMKDFFSALLGIGENGAVFQNSIFSEILINVVVCYAMNFYLTYRGISRGIERFCLWAMPALVICGLILMFYVMFLGNPTGIEGQSYLNGLRFVWSPVQEGKTFLESFSNPETWVVAAGQVFFSYSLGFGLIMTYASYLKHNDDIALSSLIAVGGNFFCEVMIGGMMVVPVAVMFLGKEAFSSLNSTFSLGFLALPQAFEQMSCGYLFGFSFFFLLFLAAVTSSISMLQPSIVFFEESLGIGRKRSISILWILTFIGTLFILYFSKGLTSLDTFDFWGGSLIAFIMATMQIIVFGWVFGIDKGIELIRHGANIPIPRFVRWIIKYVMPLYLLIIFGLWMRYNLPKRIKGFNENDAVQKSVAFMLLFAVFLIIILAQAIRRWRKRGVIARSGKFHDGSVGFTEGEL
ncbi:MAG: sodium-dependent transporter [Planctomycetaceae bacterium]|jgi:SNF family Na+-dependent transporter|nr:sodium-dependent transporter [Planctomycetaceae bacterium]